MSAATLESELVAMTEAELRAVLEQVRGTTKRGVRRAMTPAEALLYGAVLSELHARRVRS